MARKKYKDKNRSCPMCKPHKRNWEVRWSAKEEEALALAGKEIREALSEANDESENQELQGETP